MPIYSFRCENDHSFERFAPMSRYADEQICDCGAPAKLFLTPPIVFVKPDIRYTSPIDGKPITSMSQRRDDLARNGCIEYDPEVKKDFHRRIEREDRELDKAVDETVEKAIEQMPSRKREKLEAELSGGMSVESVRSNASLKPIKVDING